jgi:hypothetical protein
LCWSSGFSLFSQEQSRQAGLNSNTPGDHPRRRYQFEDEDENEDEFDQNFPRAPPLPAVRKTFSLASTNRFPQNSVARA